MQLEIKTWAYDILTAIHEIEIFVEEVVDFETYQGDTKTRRAIERNLEIIGEAMNRILNLDNSIHFTDARKIVGTRNRIIHGYDAVSDEVLWGIITTSIPILKKEIEEFLL